MPNGLKINITSDASKAKKGFKQIETQASKTSQKIQKGLQAAQGGVMGFIKHLASAHPTLTAITAGIGLVTSSMMVAVKWAKQLASKYDGIAKAAKSLNMNPLEYQALLYAGNLSGVDEQKMTNLLNILIAKQAEAVNGSILMVDAFEKLGITIKDLKEMNPAQLLISITKQLQNPNIDQQYGLTKIIGVKNAGSIRKLAKEDVGYHMADFYSRFGIPEESLSAGEKLNDEIYRFDKALQTQTANIERFLGLQGKVTKFYQAMTKFVQNDKDGKLPEYLSPFFETRSDVAKRLLKYSYPNEKYDEYVKFAAMARNPFIKSKEDWLKDEIEKFDPRFQGGKLVVQKRGIKDINKVQDLSEKYDLYAEQFKLSTKKLKKTNKTLEEYFETLWILQKDGRKTIDKYEKAIKSKNKTQIDKAEIEFKQYRAAIAAMQNYSQQVMGLKPVRNLADDNPEAFLKLYQDLGVFDDLNKQAQLEAAKYSGNEAFTQIHKNAEKIADAKYKERLQTIDSMISDIKDSLNKAKTTEQKKKLQEKIKDFEFQKVLEEEEKQYLITALRLKQTQLQGKIANAALDRELRNIEDTKNIEKNGISARKQIAYRQWKEQYGTEITDEMKKKIDKIIQYEFKDSASKLASYDQHFITNQLARRGGFTSSVVEFNDPNRTFQNNVVNVLERIEKSAKTTAENLILK